MSKVYNDPHHWLLHSGLKDALFWKKQELKNVQCNLCPRNCYIKPGSFGYCSARYNDDGVLKTAIWGKLLTPSVEPIETEAVYHYWPGSKIFSLGNLGCNLSCDFCQNWESSNIDNLKEDYVVYYTPEEIIALVKKLGLQVISFTYNDPVVWFEFVYETAKLAHKEGIKTLYKSAAFISLQAVEKLTEVIDVFSISIKSFNPITFHKMSNGVLNPVLEATKLIYKSQRHLEISNLMVTELTDKIEEVRLLARWIKNELSDQVPVHFVRFHPAYKYTHVSRTSIDFLEQTRQAASEEGLQYIYIGNTYQEGHADIFCKDCEALLIQRFGLYTRLIEITKEGSCNACGKKQNIEMQPTKTVPESTINDFSADTNEVWKWLNSDAPNIHIQAKNKSENEGVLVCDHINENDGLIEREIINIPGALSLRYAVGQSSDTEKEVKIRYSDSIVCQIAALEDRAHFPCSL